MIRPLFVAMLCVACGVASIGCTMFNKERIGPSGWKEFLTVEWSRGLESCSLYLDAERGFLSYSLTW